MSLIPTLLTAQQNQSSRYSIEAGDTLDLKQIYLDKAAYKSRNAKTFGYLSLASLAGSYFAIQRAADTCGDSVCGSGLVVAVVLIYGAFPIFGITALVQRRSAKRLREKAAALSFYYDGEKSDLRLSNEEISLMFGPTNNGVGLTLTF